MHICVYSIRYYVWAKGWLVLPEGASRNKICIYVILEFIAMYGVGVGLSFQKVLPGTKHVYMCVLNGSLASLLKSLDRTCSPMSTAPLQLHPSTSGRSPH